MVVELLHENIDLFKSPELFPFYIVFEEQALFLAHLSERDYKKIPMLSVDHIEESRVKQVIKIPLALEFLNNSTDLELTRGLNVVFHTTFCGSTAFSLNLQNLCGFHTLREPGSFFDLARTYLGESFEEKLYSQAFSLVSTLAKRTFLESQTSVTKFQNHWNYMALEFFKRLPESKAIFLIGGLSHYLSLVKNSEFYRGYFDRHFQVMVTYPFLRKRLEGINGEHLNVLQKAGILWLLQIENLNLALSSPYRSQIKVISFNGLLSNPDEAMEKASVFFDPKSLCTPNQELRLMGFHRHAKTGKLFNPEGTLEQLKHFRSHSQSEIQEVLEWLQQFSLKLELEVQTHQWLLREDPFDGAKGHPWSS